MPAAAVTIGYLVGRVHTRLWGIGAVDAGIRTEILFALDNAFQDIMGEVDLADFRSEFEIVTQKGTTDYELPEDFRTLIHDSIRFDESPWITLRWYDQMEFDEAERENRFRGESRPRGWTYVAKRQDDGRAQIRLKPPADTNYKIKGRYYIIGQDISTADDADVLDRRFPRELVAALHDGALLWLEQFANPESVALAAQVYRRHLKKARKLSKRRIGVKVQQRRYRPGRHGGFRDAFPRDFQIDGSGVDFGSAP